MSIEKVKTWWKGLQVAPLQRSQGVVIAVLLTAGLVSLLAWGLSQNPSFRPVKLVALVRGTGGIDAGVHTGSAPPTADSLAAYRAGLLKQSLASFRQPFVQEDWVKFRPVVKCPKGRPLTKYGQGDGSKLLCRTDGLSRSDGSPCIIYSLGSNGDFQFEESMLQHTTCDVFTFDCTYDGRSINPERHHYRKWCIGTGSGPEWRTWSDIISSLGHTSVDLLKMDVEGHEYPVLAGFKPHDALPGEISMEIHVKFGLPGAPETSAELAFIFLHLANLGYAPYSQEVNVIAPQCCCEFTFMRVSNMSGCNSR